MFQRSKPSTLLNGETDWFHSKHFSEFFQSNPHVSAKITDDRELSETA